MPMNGHVDQNGAPKTLYVGNLDNNITEDLIVAVFGQVGGVKGCKIIREPGNDPYCFVEFQQHSEAQAALTTMNKRNLVGREIKVNWASSPAGGMPKQVSWCLESVRVRIYVIVRNNIVCNVTPHSGHEPASSHLCRGPVTGDRHGPVAERILRLRGDLRLPRGEGPRHQQEQGLRLLQLREAGGGGRRHRADGGPVAGQSEHPDKLGHQEASVSDRGRGLQFRGRRRQESGL